MSSDSEAIVGHIQHHLNNQSTGALFLKLTDGQLLQLFFINGQIQSMKYHGSTGLDVLSELDGLEVVKSQFHDDAVSRIVNQLPNTIDIIDIIKSKSAVDISASAVGAGIGHDQVANIERAFIAFVGPIGDMIFKEELENAKSKADLISRLSQQLDSSDRSAFESEAQ